MRKIAYLSLILCLILTLVITASVSAAPTRADRGAWAPNVAYAVNDTVSYASCSYKVLQAHTSLTGWEPPTTPALFQQLSCGSVPTSTRTKTPVGPTPTITKTNTIGIWTNTPTRTSTVSCILPTPERLLVSPVTSPTTATSQVVNVTLNNGVSVSITGPAGTFTSTTKVNNVFSVTVNLTANSTNNLQVQGTVQVSPGCTYTLNTSVDSSGNPLSIVQTSAAATATRTRTLTPTPTRTPTSGSNSCSGIPQYVAGTSYNAGQIVQNVNNRYMCSVAGWCSSTAAWAYAPGTGTYWTDAWSLVGPCDTGPTLTPSRTPTPCTTCGGSLPYHVITGYWQNFNNGAMVLRLSSVPTSYNLIAVSFADATGAPGAVTFNIDSGLSTALGGYTNAQFTSDVATVRARGQKVIISVGGQNGTISVSDSSSATNFSNSIIGLMNTFGFDGVDIDLENGINATYMAQALRAVVAAKPGAIITFAPQTIDFQSTSAGYYQLAVSIKDILTINNMQYYNSGSMLGCNGSVYSQGSVDFITSQACIQLNAGLRPDQIGLGLPASTSGAGSGYVSPSVVNNALDCLAAGTNCGAYHPTTPRPGIRGAMTWSINWDASNGYAWVNAIAAHLSAVP